MVPIRLVNLFFCILTAVAALGTQSPKGIEALVRRRLPNHAHAFTFSIDESLGRPAANDSKANDAYQITNGGHGKIQISGNTAIALATGLRWYLSNILHVDIYWHIGSQLDLAPSSLPRLNGTQHGSSTVPWRYHFNTCTFSYTANWWDWDAWQLQLDWMALHGINLPLAWLGYEKFFQETLVEAGFTPSQVIDFLSGPAFQTWNRFGNIQKSWGGKLPQQWIDGQAKLGEQIVARMVELGMTPVLPAFTGFVPETIAQVFPNATFSRGPSWGTFTAKYSNDTFLSPSDPLYQKLQKSFISKQKKAYGDVSNIYTLDQYNENAPQSGDLDELKKISSETIQSLKAANPDAVWMMQGWMFYYQSYFWTLDRIKAYLDGVDNKDMIILDLYSESYPQWQRTSSYFGKPWIWCELHDFGEGMGLYGQVENVTVDAAEAAAQNTNMVGMGLTMEGQEGNQVIYDILLDQAWSEQPLDAEVYFTEWVRTRYNEKPNRRLPKSLFAAWDTLRSTIYNNTDLNKVASVPGSSITSRPQFTTATISNDGYYDDKVLLGVWTQFFKAGGEDIQLWRNEAYKYDLVDISRQVLANAFDAAHQEFVHALNTSDTTTAKQHGATMMTIIQAMDRLLAASSNNHFKLGPWIEAARALGDDAAKKDFYEYNARNQITLWGPSHGEGEISDYAGKQWAGLISTYYKGRWEICIGHMLNNSVEEGKKKLQQFELDWQTEKWQATAKVAGGDLKAIVGDLVRNYA